MEQTIEVKVQNSERAPLKSLEPFQGNLKSLSEVNFTKLKEKILRFGIISPIHVWVNETRFYILDGHQRVITLTRMQDEGFQVPEIPIVRIEASSIQDAKKKLLALASQDGEMSEQGLFDFINDSQIDFTEVKDLYEFKDIDFEKFEEEFFKAETGGLGSSGDSSGNALDETPEAPAVAKTKRGELWHLGDHRLLCGDATNTTDVQKLFAGDKAEITFTSPPYNLGRSVALRNGSFGDKKNVYQDHGDTMTEPEFLNLLCRATNLAINYSQVQIVNIQMLSGNKKALVEWLYQFREHLVDTLIWNKTNVQPAMAERVVDSDFEFLFVLSAEKNPNRAIKTSTFGRGKMSNVFSYYRGDSRDVEGAHGATFPVEFAEHHISNLSSGSVYDPFAGSGTTLVVCEKLGRKSFGMEIDPIYVDVSLKRYAKVTGKDPVRSDGVKWSSL